MCSALMATCRVRRFRKRLRGMRLRPIAQDSYGDGENNRTALKRLAEQRSHQPCRLVAAEGCNYCRFVCRCTFASRDLDCCPALDGDCVHFKREALWTHPLPLYRPLLLGDDTPGACSGIQPNLREHLRMARTCPSHSLWWLAYLVGDRTAMGQVLERLMPLMTQSGIVPN